jgi:hypothetical protein
MPGYSARKPASTCGSQPAASEGSSAIDTRPRRRAAWSRTPLSALSNSSSTRRAEASNSRPSTVSSTERVLRSNRRSPSASSSWRISALKAGCERCDCTAARVKLRCSASAMKARSWRVDTFRRLAAFICIPNQLI